MTLNKEIEKVILRIEDNVIYVDLALNSMLNSIDKWYNDYFQNDPYDAVKKAHKLHLTGFYDINKFKNKNTIGKERDKLLEEVDLYVQMRRDE